MPFKGYRAKSIRYHFNAMKYSRFFVCQFRAEIFKITTNMVNSYKMCLVTTKSGKSFVTIPKSTAKLHLKA